MVDERLRSLREQTFAGRRMAQSWTDLWLWERLLNEHPVLRTIIEIGTWEGGMSRFLDAQARNRGLAFITLDADEASYGAPGFLRMDVFAEADRVRGMIEALAPVALLCDGGNKPRELAVFGPSLQQGSLLIVHDWGDEVGVGDVPACLKRRYVEECVALESHSAVFARA